MTSFLILYFILQIGSLFFSPFSNIIICSRMERLYSYFVGVKETEAIIV